MIPVVLHFQHPPPHSPTRKPLPLHSTPRCFHALPKSSARRWKSSNVLTPMMSWNVIFATLQLRCCVSLFCHCNSSHRRSLTPLMRFAMSCFSWTRPSDQRPDSISISAPNAFCKHVLFSKKSVVRGLSIRLSLSFLAFSTTTGQKKLRDRVPTIFDTLLTLESAQCGNVDQCAHDFLISKAPAAAFSNLLEWSFETTQSEAFALQLADCAMKHVSAASRDHYRLLRARVLCHFQKFNESLLELDQISHPSLFYLRARHRGVAFRALGNDTAADEEFATAAKDPT